MKILETILLVFIISILLLIMNGSFDGNTSSKIELPRADYYCAENTEVTTIELKTSGKTMAEQLVKTNKCAVYKLRPANQRGILYVDQ